MYKKHPTVTGMVYLGSCGDFSVAGGQECGQEHQKVTVEMGWSQCLKKLPCCAKDFRFYPMGRREVERC